MDPVVLLILQQLVTRLNNLHPSRRGVKRNACAVDMLCGAAIALDHSGDEKRFNSLQGVAVLVSIRGADELVRMAESK